GAPMADNARALPMWSDAADGSARRGPPAGRPSRDGWLIVIGALYPVIAFGVLLYGGGRWGPAAFSPLVVPLPALLLIASVVGLRVQGVRLRWGSVAAFAAWVLLVACGQWLVYAAAVAAV